VSSHSHGAERNSQRPHGHPHSAAEAGAQRLAWALGLILALIAGEIVAGIAAHSLALLSDAGHMVVDASALALSLLALRLAARPAGGALTFGLRRLEVLSAQANGVTLLLLAALIVYAAIVRLVHPPHVHAGVVLAVALAGAAVNLLAVRLLAGPSRGSLALEGSFQHIVTDLYGFLGTALAAAVILGTGFQRADPIVSLLVAGLMVKAGAGLVRESARIFLEAAPAGLDPEAIGAALARERGVVEVHDLHVWELTSDFPSLSAHVLVGADEDCHAVRRRLEELLRTRFGIDHTTLQVDHAGEDPGLLEIAPQPSAGAPRGRERYGGGRRDAG
jgi:cobalt-zinc-cadmium efflux system protein